MKDLQYNPDGTIDLKWFNSLSNDDQIMFGGKWTAEQFAGYKSKKANLEHQEILDTQIEDYIEDCLEIARIEIEKFGTNDYFLGRNEEGEFILVGPYYNDFYKRIHHEFLLIDKTGIFIDFSYSDFYDEYEYKPISEGEFQTVYKIFEEANTQISDLLMNGSRILDRKVREGDYVWCYGGVIKIKAISYEIGKFWSTGYHCEGCGFAVYQTLDSIPYDDDDISSFEQNEDWPHLLITEEAFLKGYEIAKNSIDEINDYIENLYLRVSKLEK